MLYAAVESDYVLRRGLTAAPWLRRTRERVWPVITQCFFDRGTVHHLETARVRACCLQDHFLLVHGLLVSHSKVGVLMEAHCRHGQNGVVTRSSSTDVVGSLVSRGTRSNTYSVP